MTANDDNVTSTDALKAEIIEKSLEATPKGMKVVVLVLGILIIGMLLLIIGKIVFRAPKEIVVPKPAIVTERVVAAQPTSLMRIKPMIDVVRPDGATLVSSHISGKRLMLQFKSTDGADSIMIVDLTNGSVISKVVIAP